MEDKWFYWHPGVNPVSLLRAAVDNLQAGRTVRGGSTLSMQIARMMEPKARTVPNKLIEMARAIQLELTYSKEELLELYFNLAPYGGNIEGVGAASYLYFGSSPGELSLSEIAILTAIPASPSRFRPDRDPGVCAQRRERVLAALLKAGLVSRQDYDQASKEEIPSLRRRSPVIAPHLCRALWSSRPGVTEIHSTLDAPLQVTCERMARQYQAALSTKSIYNLSLVVLDNRTGELLVMVGSADFDDVQHQGQVNGALAPRSPGSTLKPFAYALGFDAGIVTPGLRVEDLPVNYSGYEPTNFDGLYHGVVSVSEALIQSLNVPAVNLTSRVGLKSVYDLLRSGGVTTLDRKYYEYGLPLILGSCELNLLELSNLYATLARGGCYRPVRLAADDASTQSGQIFSPQAAYLVTEILSELKRPDLPTSWEFTTDLPRVAWKTGTSYGRKDAWAIGYDPVHTVGVWAGNFSAAGAVALVGAEVAAPLMFNIFSHLSTADPGHWFRPPLGIDERRICALSGQVSGPTCPNEISEPYVIGVSPMTRCEVHRTIWVDKHTGFALCKYCAPGKQAREVTVEEWAPRIAAWQLERRSIELPAPHHPDCTGRLAGLAPVIMSPEQDAVYSIRTTIPIDFQQIRFQASPASDGRLIHWFLDGELMATALPDHEVFYPPKRGRHELVCVDAYGRSSRVSFQVQ